MPVANQLSNSHQRNHNTSQFQNLSIFDPDANKQLIGVTSSTGGLQAQSPINSEQMEKYFQIKQQKKTLSPQGLSPTQNIFGHYKTSNSMAPDKTKTVIQ